MKDVAAWASSLEVAEITGPGLFYGCERPRCGWSVFSAKSLLSRCHKQWADGRYESSTPQSLTEPGAKTVHWRAHVLINPSSASFRAVELTDDSGGEKPSRHPVQKGELILGDRAYGIARGVHAVRQAEAHVLVRFNPTTLRTCDGERHCIMLQEKEADVPQMGAVEFNLMIPVPPAPTKSHKTWELAKAMAWVPARAIAARTRTGEVIWILTTLNVAELPAIGALALYRLRWQIELLFKRLKSLLHLDTLPSRQGPTAQKLDVGPAHRSRASTAFGATVGSTFPLGIPIASRTRPGIALGLVSA